MVVFNDVEKCNILGGVADKGFCIVELDVFNYADDDVSCYDLGGHKRVINDERFCFFPLERVNDFSVDDLWDISRKRERAAAAAAMTEYWKRYREEHKVKIAENWKKYYEEHKDERAEYWKKYREEHKDKIAEWQKKYYEKNKDKIAEYYEKNKDKIAEYYQEHKDERQQRARDHYYLKRYGMTEAEYKAKKKKPQSKYRMK